MARIFNTKCDGCPAAAQRLGGAGLVDGRWRYGGSDGSLFQSDGYGRPRGAAYGGVMSAVAIWKVIAYIRTQPGASRADGARRGRPVEPSRRTLQRV
jgi:mono/diheme cytochrome c family protein